MVAVLIHCHYVKHGLDCNWTPDGAALYFLIVGLLLAMLFLIGKLS